MEPDRRNRPYNICLLYTSSALLSASTKPGDVKYVDVSGPDGTPDGIINETYDRVVLGSSLPHYLSLIHILAM